MEKFRLQPDPIYLFIYSFSLLGVFFAADPFKILLKWLKRVFFAPCSYPALSMVLVSCSVRCIISSACTLSLWRLFFYFIWSSVCIHIALCSYGNHHLIYLPFRECKPRIYCWHFLAWLLNVSNGQLIYVQFRGFCEQIN